MAQSTSLITQKISLHFLLSIAIVQFLAMTVMCKNDSSDKDISRKSIVFDIKTPKVFYCPQEKQSSSEKTIVMAKPLNRLCEFKGKPKPKNSPSDCYNDVDETDFACEEKKRFMVSIDTGD